MTPVRAFTVEDVHASIVEHGVPADARTMTREKVFWSHFCTNLGPAAWVLGALVVTVGLDVRWGFVALVLGNVLGALPVAACATLGPQTGLTQIEISRFSFGRTGTRVPSALNWLCAVGWDAVNNVPSVLALGALAALGGIGLPFWLGLALLAGTQMLASAYGHHLVQAIGKYLSYVLVVVFAITGVVAIARGGSLTVAHAHVTPATFVLAVSMVAGFAIGFAPYSSDYTRYLAPGTSLRRVAWLSGGGLALSGFGVELLGLLTASRLTDVSPAGVIGSVTALTGAFAPIALLAIALAAIPVNSINENTAAYSLISAGVRLPRPISAIVTGGCGYALAVAGAGTFAELFSGYMLVLLYWIAPWASIVLADWYVVRDRARRVGRWRSGATIFALVTPLTILLFSSTQVYVGPIARLLGGTDVGSFVGFLAAGGLYVLVQRRHGADAAQLAGPVAA